jgi:DNA repair protein RAD7
MMTELRLNEIGKMNDEWLQPLEALTCLTSLELRNSGMMYGPSLTDGAVNKLLEAIGGNLRLLDLSSQKDLTDEVLLEGIGKHCHSLTNLVLSDLPELSDLGVTKFFDEWSLNPALEKLDLSRCHELGTRALDAISKHSGEKLVSLNINSWKELGTEALVRLVERTGARLGELDVSWCRMVDNFVMKDVLEKCVKLRWVKCYGCNRLNEECPKKVSIIVFSVIVTPNLSTHSLVSRSLDWKLILLYGKATDLGKGVTIWFDDNATK